MKDDIEKMAKAVTYETTIEINRLYNIIDEWFIDNFHDSVVSRETRIINKVIDAKHDLLERISTLTKE